MLTGTSDFLPVPQTKHTYILNINLPCVYVCVCVCTYHVYT